MKKIIVVSLMIPLMIVSQEGSSVRSQRYPGITIEAGRGQRRPPARSGIWQPGDRSRLPVAPPGKDRQSNPQPTPPPRKDVQPTPPPRRDTAPATLTPAIPPRRDTAPSAPSPQTCPSPRGTNGPKFSYEHTSKHPETGETLETKEIDLSARNDIFELLVINPKEEKVRVRIRHYVRDNGESRLLPVLPTEADSKIKLLGNSESFQLPEDYAFKVRYEGLDKPGRIVVNLWPENASITPDLNKDGKPQNISPRNKEYTRTLTFDYPGAGISSYHKIIIDDKEDTKVEYEYEQWTDSATEEVPDRMKFDDDDYTVIKFVDDTQHAATIANH